MGVVPIPSSSGDEPPSTPPPSVIVLIVEMSPFATNQSGGPLCLYFNFKIED
ncbi:hypothetical protein Hanom_Chr10g00885961 [Helianthus anomalus]